MAPLSNRELVGRAMDKLQNGLNPFVEREMKAAVGDDWFIKAQAAFAQRSRSALKDEDRGKLDVQALLHVMLDNWGQHPDWNGVFGKKLGKAERQLADQLMRDR